MHVTVIVGVARAEIVASRLFTSLARRRRGRALDRGGCNENTIASARTREASLHDARWPDETSLNAISLGASCRARNLL